MAKYQNFTSSLGIPGYLFYVGRDSKCLKSRTLTVPEKLKVFRNIRIAELVPKLNPQMAIKVLENLCNYMEVYSNSRSMGLKNTIP